MCNNMSCTYTYITHYYLLIYFLLSTFMCRRPKCRIVPVNIVKSNRRPQQMLIHIAFDAMRWCLPISQFPSFHGIILDHSFVFDVSFWCFLEQDTRGACKCNIQNLEDGGTSIMIMNWIFNWSSKG